MKQDVTVQTWWTQFTIHAQSKDVAKKLKSASLAERLGEWTKLTTGVVVEACDSLGWDCAARGRRGTRLPESASEYLALDGMSFPNRDTNSTRWPMPLAVFELENSKRDDRVGYSLWKVLCVRAGLRIVFAYRRDWGRTRDLVDHLTENVIAGFTGEERMKFEGHTALVTGSRGESETFPHGYFKLWLLDTNLGKFNRI